MNSDNIEKENEESFFTTLKTKISKHIIQIFFIIGVIIAEIFFREPLFNFSLVAIPFMQKYLYYFYPVGNFFSFFATEKGLVAVIIIAYNYLNNYQTLMLLVTSLSSVYFGGVLKLIYLSPRPFMASQNVIAFGCEGGWGNPSNHALCSTCFYLSLYNIAIKPSKSYSKKQKETMLYYIIGFIFFICFSRVFLGVHSINQVLYGSCLGLFLYYLIFHIIQIDITSSNEFLSVIYNGKLLILGIIALIATGIIPYFVFSRNEVLIQQWDAIIEAQCPGFPQAKRFEYESLMCIWGFSSIIPAIIGNCVEFFYIFDSNVTKWRRYNFSPLEEKEQNLISSEIPEEDTKWNETECGVSIKRIVIICLVCGFLMIPHLLVSYKESFLMIITVKTLLPVYLIAFVMFSYMKTFLGVCGATNQKLFKNNLRLDEEAAINNRFELDRIA